MQSSRREQLPDPCDRMEEEVDCETEPSVAATLSKSIGFQRIDIVLDHPHKVYHSGHQVSGNVHLDLDEPVNGLGIRLKCKGEAQVYFTDRSAGIRRKFSALESYLHVETYLVGDGKEKSTITGGVYPFTVTLPENLPCSFEGRYGRVRYSIRALLDVTTIYRFSTNIIPFTVAPILDLNRDSLAPLPINVQQSKVYMGQTEPLKLSMSLPVHGYVPGQAIPIKIVMTNPSTVVVKKIRIVFKKFENQVALLDLAANLSNECLSSFGFCSRGISPDESYCGETFWVVTYHSTEKSRKHKEIVVEVEQPVNKDPDTYDVTFDVPAVPPTGMIHCNIIDVLYTLKVEACVDVSEWYYRMFQKNLKLRTNIVVGTVPLQNYETPQKTASLTEAVPFHPPSTTTTEEYATNAPSLKNLGKEDTAKRSVSSLTLYEKSQIYRSSKPDSDDPTGDDGDSDGEVKPYSPMYRVYNFKSSRKNNN